MRLLFVLLLCLKVMGAFSESAPAPGTITINGFGADSLGVRYLYYNNSQGHFECHVDRNILNQDYGNDNGRLRLIYIPKDGIPISTEYNKYYANIYIKLSTEHHNARIECHTTELNMNKTTVTKILLQNIDVLKKNGNSNDQEVIGTEDLRRFKVNGSNLGYKNIPTLDQCTLLPKSMFAVDKGYQSEYMVLNEQEPLSISFLKRDDDVNASLTCRFEGPITKNPQYRSPYLNEYNYEVIYKEEYSVSQLICTLYSEEVSQKYVLQLVFIPDYRGFEVNGLVLDRTKPESNACLPPPSRAMDEGYHTKFTLFSEEILNISFLKSNYDVRSNLTCMFQGPITEDSQYQSPYYNNYSIEIMFKTEYSGSKLECMFHSPSVHKKYSLLLLYKNAPLQGLSAANVLMTTYGKDWALIDIFIEYNTNTDWFCQAGHAGHGWTYFNESEVDCLEYSDRNKIPETCTFNFINGFNKTTVKCSTYSEGSVTLHLIKNKPTPSALTSAKGKIIVHSVNGVETLAGGRYLYHNNSANYFKCLKNPPYDGKLYVRMRYIPRDGHPFASGMFHYDESYMYMKLTAEHHNTILQCLVSTDPHYNMYANSPSTLLEVRLENIEILKKNGDYNGPQNVLRGFTVKGVLLSRKDALESENYEYEYTFYDREPLTISFVKDDVNTSLTCKFEGHITEDPQYKEQYGTKNHTRYELIYKKEYEPSQLICSVHSGSVQEKYILKLNRNVEDVVKCVATSNILMRYKDFSDRPIGDTILLEYNTNTELTCTNWEYYNENEVECPEKRKNHDAKSCTFNLINGFNKTKVVCGYYEHQRVDGGLEMITGNEMDVYLIRNKPSGI